MDKPLVSSGLLKQVLAYLHFKVRVFKKWLLLLLKKNRNLQLEEINYFKNWQFSNAYLLIDIRCENAIWYEIQKMKFIADNKLILLDLNNIQQKEICIIIYGFNNKKTVILPLQHSLYLDNSSFQTKINVKIALNPFPNLQLKNLVIPTFWTDRFSFRNKKPIINLLRFQVEQKEIRVAQNDFIINHSQFNIEEYL